MSDARKPKTIAIDANLHRYLKLLTARENVGMNALTEPALWDIVRQNREWLEQMTGGAVNLPNVKQPELAL